VPRVAGHPPVASHQVAAEEMLPVAEAGGTVRGGRAAGGRVQQILIVTGRRKRTLEDHFDPDPELVTTLKQAAMSAIATLGTLRASPASTTPPECTLGPGHAISLGADFVDGEECVSRSEIPLSLPRIRLPHFKR